jgi:hypothetical protein
VRAAARRFGRRVAPRGCPPGLRGRPARERGHDCCWSTRRADSISGRARRRRRSTPKISAEGTPAVGSTSVSAAGQSGRTGLPRCPSGPGPRAAVSGVRPARVREPRFPEPRGRCSRPVRSVSDSDRHPETRCRRRRRPGGSRTASAGPTRSSADSWPGPWHRHGDHQADAMTDPHSAIRGRPRWSAESRRSGTPCWRRSISRRSRSSRACSGSMMRIGTKLQRT